MPIEFRERFAHHANPETNTLHLVIENLSSHGRKALVESGSERRSAACYSVSVGSVGKSPRSEDCSSKHKGTPKIRP
jgi:hypothetical protein